MQLGVCLDWGDWQAPPDTYSPCHPPLPGLDHREGTKQFFPSIKTPDCSFSGPQNTGPDRGCSQRAALSPVQRLADPWHRLRQARSPGRAPWAHCWAARMHGRTARQHPLLPTAETARASTSLI